MLADELARDQARAAIQAEERSARHEARSRLTLPHSISPTQPDPFSSITAMEDHHYNTILDSIPVFSGTPHENIAEWLDIVNLKFDIIGYDSRQKRRFIPQYLAGNALKWHLLHRNDLSSWDDYLGALTPAFPLLITTSRDMNLKLLRDRKQSNDESFIDYYTSIVNLCRKHAAEMPDVQIIDWLKAGMKLTLYEKLQGEEFATPQALLLRAQRVELDNALLDARKNESLTDRIALSTSNFDFSTPSTRWNPSFNSPTSSKSYSTSSYPVPLLSTGPHFRLTSSSNTPRSHYSFSSQSRSSNYHGSNLNNRPFHHRRPIICYSCNQPGHISPHCPSHPKE